MSISRRELIRRASALSLSAASASLTSCGDDSGDGSSEAGTSGGTTSGSTGGAGSSSGELPTTTAADSSSTGGDDGLPRYEYEGEPGPETIFSHGVASGDPLLDAVILWTRLTLEADGAVEAFFEVALDPEFEMRVAADYIGSVPDRDQTIKLDVEGLNPGTTYYYRFFSLGRESSIGRTRTAPQGAVDRLRVAVCSCASLAHGYFHAYRRVAERADLDVVIHLGDYIYEYGTGEYGELREYEPSTEIVSLDDYRTRYAQYRRESDLQELHRQHPMVAVWDDHESANNAYRDGAENHQSMTEGEWEDRKAVAFQSYAEWMPFREGAQAVIYRALPYGDLMHLIMLDTRIVGRDEQPGDLSDPDDLDDPDRQLLGMEQEAWMVEQITNSTAQWKLIGQQVVMAEVILGEGPFNADQWDGYRAARSRFYDLAESTGNVVVLTGDIHSSWAFDLAVDPAGTYDPADGSGSVGVEFVVPAVSSPGFPLNAGPALLAANPHLRWIDIRERGYLLLDVDTQRVQASWWFVDEVESTDGGGESLAAVWAVRDGTDHLEEEQEAAEPLPDAPAPAP
ncbi:MAG: alkaline phosphatase D family protein [Nannocystaceae bacterium]|nr:alkaline phosphatase D family protein [Nannocystaceae bacterium]